MNFGPQLLLVASVATVGVLHTIVPDHWVPITLIARQRGWSKTETARAALQAGTGHVLSTLFIALVIWLSGLAFAERFGHLVDRVSSLALVTFGAWIAVAAWRDMRRQGGHGHSHGFPNRARHDQGANRDCVPGTQSQRIVTDEGVLELSIVELASRAFFRLSGIKADAITVQTRREDDTRQDFTFTNRATCWESVEEIPEPHEFGVSVIFDHDGHAHRYETQFSRHPHPDGGHGQEHGPGHDREQAPDHEGAPEDDPLYAPLRDETAVLTRHVHMHRHGRGSPHLHWHDHRPDTAHTVTPDIETAPPLHEHLHKTSARTAMLLILGSSPMVEGIPAFFAAGKYGVGLIAVMAVVFAVSTIATYVLLCVYSTAGLQRVRLGAFERYGEVLSGAFIALVGVAFSIWPVL